MRRLSILSVSCALLLSRLTLARSISRRADLPACAQPCFLLAVEQSGCPADDAPCICDNQGFYESLMPCVLTTCGFHDVAGLLNFGLDFCNRTGVNSVERLNGAVKVDVDSSTTVVPSAAAPTPVTAPATSPDTSEPYVPPVAAPSTPASSTERPSVNLSSVEAEVSSTTFSSTAALSTPSGSEVSSEAVVETPTTRVPPGQFTIESSSQTEEPNSETVATQTAVPSSQTTSSVSKTVPLSSSAPPAPTADTPSSASVSALKTLTGNIPGTFMLCFVALFLAL